MQLTTGTGDDSRPLSFRPATKEDAPAIVRLVNSAYRGESSKIGWTTEADLLGGQRTDEEEVLGLIETEGSLILLAFSGPTIVGSVHLQKTGSAAYLGMFAIDPRAQGGGIGKRFLETAERLVEEKWGSDRVVMTVISVRHDVIAYYERRGYRRTGEMKPFPQGPRYGIPKVAELRLEVLEKKLGGK